MPGDPQGDDGFGAFPAVGDVNADGRPDLVVATPEEDRGNGRLTLLPGSGRGHHGEYDPAASNREGVSGEQAIDLDTPGVPGRPHPYGFEAFAPQPPAARRRRRRRRP
ncbi:FG-GAP repeat protein [Streptomyces sp. NPDC005355]|uniref:FG-GAP repeat protein n=1 Tax=Streptomyces sp. NPDC005355 TaxID=3157038 RepID=UPI0033AE7AED